MEQERNKRAREDFEEAEIGSSFENNKKKAKKRDVCGMSFKKEVEEKGCCFKAWEWDNSHLAFGVFDFPWLKDGVIFKSEDFFMDFEDNFQDTFFKVSGIDYFFDEYGLCCEVPETPMAHIPEAKLVEDLWHPFESNGLELEAEDVDCIWSFLLNKPL